MPKSGEPTLGLYFTVNGFLGGVLGVVAILSLSNSPGWVVALAVCLLLLWTGAVVAVAAGTGAAPQEGKRRRSRYKAAVGPVLAWAGARLGFDPDQPAGPAKVLRGALNWRLLDAAMLLAVAYPILLVVLHWGVTGADGRLGSALVLPAEPSWQIRAAALGGVATAYGFALCINAINSQWSQRVSSLWIGLIVAVTFLGAVAVGIAVAVAVAVGIAGAGAIAVAFAVIFEGAFAGAGTAAGACAGAMFGID